MFEQGVTLMKVTGGLPHQDIPNPGLSRFLGEYKENATTSWEQDDGGDCLLFFLLLQKTFCKASRSLHMKIPWPFPSHPFLLAVYFSRRKWPSSLRHLCVSFAWAKPFPAIASHSVDYFSNERTNERFRSVAALRPIGRTVGGSLISFKVLPSNFCFLFFANLLVQRMPPTHEKVMLLQNRSFA